MTIESDTMVSDSSQRERFEFKSVFKLNITPILPLSIFCFLLGFLDGLVDELPLVVVHMVDIFY